MRDLDPRKEGFVTREDFMHFIRNGGRRQKPDPAPSLGKRLSIELDADKIEAIIEGVRLLLKHLVLPWSEKVCDLSLDYMQACAPLLMDSMLNPGLATLRVWQSPF